jgi:hypothetical protein
MVFQGYFHDNYSRKRAQLGRAALVVMKPVEPAVWVPFRVIRAAARRNRPIS